MIFQPVLELTHNHGTENQEDFKYHNGNDDDAGQGRGFGHTGFLGKYVALKAINVVLFSFLCCMWYIYF